MRVEEANGSAEQANPRSAESMTLADSLLPPDMFPSSFAMVMATGIVSMTLDLLGYPYAANVLFALNIAAYVLVWVAGLTRIARAPREVLADIGHHVRGPQFLAIVAATNILGVQCARLAGWNAAAAALWIAGIASWVVVTYGFFVAVTVTSRKPALEHGIGGAWLLITVATESVAVLGTGVAGQFARPDIAMFASLAFFLAGGMLYILVIALIFFRWAFMPMPTHALTPPFWINMGAVAIATLAGAMLAGAAADYPFIAGLAHFVVGFTLFFWATATWWIPVLALVFAWRHLHHRTPVRYDPQYWSLVFPLGMYSVATWTCAEGQHLGFLLPLARAFGYVAIAAWTLTLAGMVRQVLRRSLALRRSG